MINKVASTQSAKDKMDINSALTVTLPTQFGKCLDTPKSDPRDIQIKKVPDTPKTEPKGYELIHYAQEHFEAHGKLKVDDRGFLYVDLPNEYIFDLFEKLDYPATELPPYFFPEKGFGAHISVALNSEEFDRNAIPFLNEEISFTITGCYSVKPEKWEGVKRVWFLTVEAPELISIRRELGLSDKLMGHEFHITFAIEKEFLALDDLLFASENRKKGIQISPEKSQRRKVAQMKRLVSHKA